MSEDLKPAASTPAATWRVNGEPDPHGSRYNGERATLAHGDMTDDELANAVFTHNHRMIDVDAIMRGEPSSMALLTASKERIRWLSRALVKAQSNSESQWVAVSERMPDAGRTVLAFYLNRLGKARRIRAVYIAEKTREANDYDFSGDECGGCYDEDTDTYYWPAGWYERIDNWDEYSHVAVTEGAITHWMVMPEGPAITKEAA